MLTPQMNVKLRKQLTMTRLLQRKLATFATGSEVDRKMPPVDIPLEDLTFLCLDSANSVDDAVRMLFDPTAKDATGPLWLHLPESKTSKILEGVICSGKNRRAKLEPTKVWIEQNSMKILECCVERNRIMDMTALIGRQKVVKLVTEQMAC